MTDYKELYFKLFASISDAMEILNKAQQEAEEIYISSQDENEKNIVNLKIIEKDDK